MLFKDGDMEKDLFMVIDMQNVYSKGGEWYCPSIDTSADNIIKVINKQNNNGGNIIFTKFIANENPTGTWIDYNVENKAVNDDVYAGEIIDVLKPYANDENTYEKSEYSSLSVPAIKDVVSTYIGLGRVVVSGVVAECCVLATVMGLIDMGVKVIYLSDAVAGIDEKTEQSVLNILEGLEPLHVRRMTTDEYLSELR